MITKVNIKISVGRLLQLAYASNNDMTATILNSNSSFSLLYNPTTDKFKLTGSTGTVTFSGKKAVDSLGFKVKNVSIKFTNGEGGVINYTGTYTFLKAGSVSISGSFDVFKLITSCSGFLCNAARLLSGRDAQIRAIIEDAM